MATSSTTTSAAKVFELSPAICKKGGSGYLFPAFRDNEQEWPQGVRAPLYLCGLVYAFLGVGVAADSFMGAIEAITSKRTRKFIAGQNRWNTVYVWNATVANLSLMALGSSAPEILLNVLEICLGNFFAGDLGPSTIVGSAAFNMFCIIAVCVIAIESPDVRKIKEVPVYCVTAVFSIFAYLWLVIILSGFSPNIVELWEALVTLLFFPVLLMLAFAADRGYLGNVGALGSRRVVCDDMSAEELAALEVEVRQKHGQEGKELTEAQVMSIIKAEYMRPASRAAHRVAATRAVTGGHKIGLKEKLVKSMTCKVTPIDDPEEKPVLKIPPGKACFSLEKKSYAVLENGKSLDLMVLRTGDLDIDAKIGYATREGTASKDNDYKHTEGVLYFGQGECAKTINVEIYDDDEIEEDEYLYMDLLEIDGGNAVIGEIQTATIVIVDDDIPGTLIFPYPEDKITVQEESKDIDVEITIERRQGSAGTISCRYHTEDDTAVAGLDFVGVKGKLEFPPNCMSQSIPITIKAHGRYEKTEMFRLILNEPHGGAKFPETSDGGEDANILSIIVEPGAAQKNRTDKLLSNLRVNWDKSKLGHANWREQFIDAIYINGGEDEDEDDEDEDSLKDADSGPGVSDWIMHILSFPWKFLFAFIPPTDYCGGWACFISALLGIGLVTLMISELASLLGCVICMPDAITAITFVALGTSLPDTFASMSAAKEDPYADASVGNVTGSNSVNVFLGLGLPWTIAALYWQAGGVNDEWRARYESKAEFKDWWTKGYFVVLAGNLSTSVVVFCICAFICITTLSVRRRAFGGELGGPFIPKVLTAVLFVSLWLVYVIVSSIIVVNQQGGGSC